MMPKRNPKGRNVHLYPSTFTNETRILRISDSLVKMKVFEQVEVIAARRDSNLSEYEVIDEKRFAWRVPTRIKRGGLLTKVLNIVEWTMRVLWSMRRGKVTCVNAHSLSVLPVSVLIKWMNNCPLVYDAHEIETETGEVEGIRKTFSQKVERWLMRFVDVVNLTSDGHAVWYRKAFPDSQIEVTHNYPYKRDTADKTSTILKDKFNIADDEMLFIYQGAIAPQRGAYLIMDAFTKLPSHKHVVFMGFGMGVDRVIALAEKHPNIYYHPAVKPEEVSLYTSSADIGIHMMDDSCINHLYALPNKILEYMNSGLPAIVSNLPEMRSVIEGAKTGWTVPVGDEEALVKLIDNLSRDDIAKYADNVKKWATNHTWQNEEKKLIAIYEKLRLPKAK